MMNRRTFVVSSASMLAMPARAQSFPGKGLQLIVPFAAGGAADITGRVVSERLAAAYGRAVIVENRAGAGSNIGLSSVARGEPTGHVTMPMTTATIGEPAISNPLWAPKILYAASARASSKSRSRYRDSRRCAVKNVMIPLAAQTMMIQCCLTQNTGTPRMGSRAVPPPMPVTGARNRKRTRHFSLLG